MRHRAIISAVAGTLLVAACNSPEPAREPVPTTVSREEAAAADLQRKRTDETTQLDERIADLGRRWSEMEGKVAAKTATATAALRAEVKEDMTNVRQAVADLRTTAPDNWWERHERAMERAADDIEADVMRLSKGKPAKAPAMETPAQAAPFASRRDQFVTRLRARVEHMENHLEDVKVSGAMKTELTDTRARVEKLKDDVERLGRAEANDWWDISAKRVREYVDRIDESIGRLDDNRR